MSDDALIFSLNDAIIQAVARLVDDAGEPSPREPSHSDLEDVFRRANLLQGDPHRNPTVRVGKQKRVRLALSWALDYDQKAGSAAIAGLIAMVRGCGGFRSASKNYCGEDAIATCIAAFDGEPVELTEDGQLRVRNLEMLAGRELTSALRSYVDKARRGYEDSVLLAGTGKDILEAVAAHVIIGRYGGYSEQADFPTLLGQAFDAVGLDAQHKKPDPGGIAGARVATSVALYDLGCSVNRFRNKAGSGHGRPFLPEITDAEVRVLTEAVGLIASRLLDELG
ncbi:MAG: hypothetical protein M0Z92_04285 [Actinomycetota bacterium]|nr:hypothetical protein [Actinomycetota bacterium]